MYNFYDVFAYLIGTTRPSISAAVELQPPLIQATACGATEIVNEMLINDFDPDVTDISSENTVRLNTIIFNILGTPFCNQRMKRVIDASVVDNVSSN